MANDRFGKFTERARRVLTLALEEAMRFNHNYIGTEHLLLGLVREGEGVAAQVLRSLGVELNRVRSAVEFIIGRGDRMIVGEVGLTPRAKKVIELAVDEARRLSHHYIGTEHLLLGLLREGEGIAAGVLESLGVNLKEARAETLKVLKQSQAGGGTAEQSPSESAAQKAQHVLDSVPGILGMQNVPASWALTDSFTGLANRRAYDERIEEELLRAQRMGRSLALLLFDVDHLKQMNAAYGHAAGDQLLRAVADTLRSRTRGIDLAARIGADEFVVLLPETDRAGAMVALERLMEGIAEQRIQGQTIQISTGVAVYPDDGRTEHDLRQHADDDLYQAKRRRQ